MYDENRTEPTPRIPYSGPVTVSTGDDGGAPQTLQIRNLGPGGLFVVCSRPLPEGEHVHVQFALPDGQPVCSPARVIRAVHASGQVQEPGGMALRFEGLDPGAARSLKLLMDGIVQLQAGPRLVEPEEEYTDPVLSQDFLNFSLSLRALEE